MEELKEERVVKTAYTAVDSQSSLHTSYDLGEAAQGYFAHPWDVRKPEPNARKIWRPFFLQRRVLIAFLAFFLLVILIVAILYRVSLDHNGISTTSNSLHYLWTYGPTAIFLIVDAVWYQVDYAMRFAMPWFAMADSAPARQSVLLDYISPVHIIVLYRALKHRHYLPAMTVTIGFLLKLLSIFFTGFFVLQLNVPVYETAPMQLVTTFDSTPYRDLVAHSFGVPDANAYNNVYTWLRSNMSLPDWSGTNMSVAQFTTLDPKDASLDLMALTDVFQPTLGDCQPAHVYFHYEDAESDGNPNTQTGPRLNYTLASNSSKTAAPFAQSGGVNFIAQFDTVTLTGDAHPSVALMFANITGFNMSASGSFKEATAMICKPSYCHFPSEVAFAPSLRDSYAHLASGGPERPTCSGIDGFNDTQMLDLVDASLQEWKQYTGSLPWPTKPSMLGDSFSFLMMNLNMNKSTSFNPADYLDAKKLQSSADAAFTALASQLVNQYVMTKANDTKMNDGVVLTHQDRLTVSGLAVGLTVGFLCAAVLLCAGLIWLTPQGLPCRPATLGSVASVFSKSFIERIFQRPGLWSFREIKSRMRDFQFKTVIETHAEGSGSHEALHLSFEALAEPVSEKKQKQDEVEKLWWTSAAGNFYFAGGLSLLLLVLIIVLEVLYRQSLANQGLGNVSESDSGLHFVWTYIPALLMTVATMLVQGSNSTARILEPYSLLRRGGASARHTLLVDWSQMSAVMVIYKALLNRRLAVLASTISLCLGPVLTVAVSGLYTVQAVPYNSTVSLRPTSTFNFTSLLDSVPGTNGLADTSFGTNLNGPSLGDDGGFVGATDASVAAVNILARNKENTVYSQLLPYLPFETISSDPLFEGASNLSVYAPLLFSEFASAPINYLNAELAQGYHQIDGGGALAEIPYTYVNMSLDLDPKCPEYTFLNTSLGGGTTVTMTNSYPVTEPFPVLYDLAVTDYFGVTLWGNISDVQSYVDSHCPFAILIYGQVANNTINWNQTSFIGYQMPRLTVQHAVMRYSLQPSMLVDLETVQTDIDAHPQTNISLDLQSYLPMPPQYPFDSVITTMLKNGHSVTDLGLNLNFIPAFEWVYQVAIEQYLMQLRSTPPNADAEHFVQPPPNWTGNFTNANRERLVQSTISTRILQSVLSVMLVCTVLTYVVLDRGDWLPANPCSLAAKASLLAHSRMLHDGTIPPGSEQYSVQEMRAAGLFSTQSFALGWWDADGKRVIPKGLRKRPKKLSGDIIGAPQLMSDMPHSQLRYGIDAED